MSGILFRYNDPVSCLTKVPRSFPGATMECDIIGERFAINPSDPRVHDPMTVANNESENQSEAREQVKKQCDTKSALAHEPHREPEPEKQVKVLKSTHSKKMVQNIPKSFNPLHPTDFERFTVKALKNHCNEQGLDVRGNRADIVNRLLAHYKL